MDKSHVKWANSQKLTQMQTEVYTSRARAHSRFQELKCYCNLNIFTTDVELDGM